MVTKLITGILVAIFMTIVIVLSRRAPKIDAETGELLLRHSSPFRILGLVALVGMPVFIAALAIKDPPQKSSDWTAVVISVCLIGTLGLLLTLEATITYVRISDRGIESRTPWTGTKAMTWSEILEVRYSGSSCWFVIIGVQGTKIRVYQWLVGIEKFVRELILNVDQTKMARAQAGIDYVLGKKRMN